MDETASTWRSWDVLLIGGASGVGKTSVSYRLARHFDVGITELDDLHITIEALTTPEQQPALHYWRTHPEAASLPAQGILDLHLAVCRALAPAVEAVAANHVESRAPIVLEGDYLLPETVARWRETRSPLFERVKAVWLIEPDKDQITRNYAEREPDAGDQSGRAQVSWLFSAWLNEECRRHGLLALPARPWEVSIERIKGAIS
jgi:2-phosphoglycerate kinase